jgi:simple sugar transport system permease protein
VDLISLVWSLAFATSAVRLAVPLVAAGVGEVISERAGVLNIGLEGMMLAGAFGGVVGADVTGSPWLGAIIGMAVAILVAIPHGVFSISLSGNQVVSGVAHKQAVS